MHLILSIYSKNMNSLTNFLKVLHKLRKKNSLKLIYYTKQSQNKKYFCFISALKSPHVNKKAQEQFEFNLYSKQLKIKVSQINKFLFVWKWIKRKLFADLKIKINFLFQHNLAANLKTANERFLPMVFFKKAAPPLNNTVRKFSKKAKKKLNMCFLIKQTLLKLTDINGEKLLKAYK